MRYGLGQPTSQLHLCSERTQVDNRNLALDPMIEKISGRRHSLFEFVFSIPPNERIRILPRRHVNNADDQIVLQKGIERTFGSFLASCVCIKAKNHLVDKAFQNSG